MFDKSMKIMKFMKKMIRDESGVSVIFGALLLLAISAVFVSAFLITAIPAKIMSEESAGNDLLLSEILKHSENDALFGRASFHSNHSTAHVIESGGIVFAANISVPPATASFLKSGPVFSSGGDRFSNFDSINDDFSNFDSDNDDFSNFDSDNDDFYKLGSGSLLFSCRYSQIPDRFYSLGESSLLLIQGDGSSFIKPPDISVRRSADDKILLSLRGDVIHSSSSPVFGNLTTLEYRTTQTADVHDFVSEIYLFYLPAKPDSVLNEAAVAQKEKAFRQWMLKFENELNRDFPELRVESDPENMMLIISSDVLFELDVTVREIDYSFS